MVVSVSSVISPSGDGHKGSGKDWNCARGSWLPGVFFDGHMDRTYILDEIKRTAAANGGQPVGQRRFLRETGIKMSDWRGKYWARWGDAVREAGHRPNGLRIPYTEEFLFESYIGLLRELCRFPTHAELSMKRRRDERFPGVGPLARFGTKADLAA